MARPREAEGLPQAHLHLEEQLNWAAGKCPWPALSKSLAATAQGALDHQAWGGGGPRLNEAFTVPCSLGLDSFLVVVVFEISVFFSLFPESSLPLEAMCCSSLWPSWRPR